MNKNRVTFIYNNTIQVFNLNKSSNKKISDGSKLVQSYTYSFEQYEIASKYGKKTPHKEFLALDKANCLDCPFSINSGNGGCYTHKYLDTAGRLSQLESIHNEFGGIENIPTYNDDVKARILANCKDRYMRFGAYGEPSLHPLELVKAAVKVAAKWTGYTHQWFKFPEFSDYYMASVHSKRMADTAAKKGWRSFLAVDEINEADKLVNCPASKEMGFASNCAKCGLCSGTKGKGKKSVAILIH